MRKPNDLYTVYRTRVADCGCLVASLQSLGFDSQLAGEKVTGATVVITVIVMILVWLVLGDCGRRPKY